MNSCKPTTGPKGATGCGPTWNTAEAFVLVFVLLAVSTPALWGAGQAAPRTTAAFQQGKEHDPHRHHQLMAAAGGEEIGQVGSLSIPDVVLLDQNGREVHFYTDLIQGKTVVINSIFTTCTTICPPMGANFARLQKMLAGRVGKDVELISLSVDPVVDTPQRLKAWSEKFAAGPGWTLLTGSKNAMDRLLKSLKFFTPDKTDHSPTILVGNPQGRWTRAYGLASPDKLAEVVRSMLEEGCPQ